jgi:hypothetical protein
MGRVWVQGQRGEPGRLFGRSFLAKDRFVLDECGIRGLNPQKLSTGMFPWDFIDAQIVYGQRFFMGRPYSSRHRS